MMEAEYGVGIKNRFAFLDGDGDNDDESTFSAPVTTTKAATNKRSDTSDKKPVESKQSNGKAENKGSVGGSNTNTTKDKAVKGRNEYLPPPPRRFAGQDERKGIRENGGFAPSERSSRNGPPSRGGGGYRRDNFRGGEPNRRNYNRNRGGEERENRNDAPGEMENSDESKVKDGEGTNGSTEVDGDTEKPEDAQLEDSENTKPEEKTLTLAEWKALQAPREKPVFNIRKPGEGEVTSKLEKLVLKKREDDIVDQEDDYEIEEVYYPQRAGKMKPVSDVGFTTGYQKRRGGGRFGPSGKFGAGDGHAREGNSNSEQKSIVPERPRGRARFNHRGVHQRPTQAPRIDDASDFPQLG